MMPDPGPPESDAVLRRHRTEEVVDLLVRVDRDAEVDRGADLGLDQVIAVHRRRHGSLGEAGGHELQQGHLRRGVLHGDTVGMEVVVGDAAVDVLVRVGQVVDEDLLGQRERASEALAAGGDPPGQAGVDALDEFDGGGGAVVARIGHVDNYNTSCRTCNRDPVNRKQPGTVRSPSVRHIRYQEIADELRGARQRGARRVGAALRGGDVAGVRRVPGHDPPRAGTPA